MLPHAILLANESRILREMLRRAFGKAPGLTVVGEVSDLAQLAHRVEVTGAEWVVVTLRPDGSLPDLIGPLQARRPTLRILGIARDGSRVRLKWAASSATDLDDPSFEELIEILNNDSPANG